MESIGRLSPSVIFWVHSFSFGFRAGSLGKEGAAYGGNNREIELKDRKQLFRSVQNADCTGYKMQTRYKMQTADWVQNAD